MEDVNEQSIGAPEQVAARLNTLHGELWAAVNKLERYWIAVQDTVTNPQSFRPGSGGPRAAFVAINEMRQVDQAADNALNALRATRDRIDESWEAAENIGHALTALLTSALRVDVIDLVAEEAIEQERCG